MTKINSRFNFVIVALVALASLIMLMPQVQAQSGGMDPAATQSFKQMLDYLAGLKNFSVHTQNTLEDTLDSGQRIDIDISANVIVSRPDRLKAERKGELIDQVFYYNGKILTLYNPSAMAYATEPAPATIEEMLDYTRESLGLIIPAADMLYQNAYPLMMQGVTSAMLIGKTVIDGQVCSHLAFSRPDVDFQVWIADGDQPLPCKYVVTDTSTPAKISVSTVMSQWNISPVVNHDHFNFVPPEGTIEITFMPLDSTKQYTSAEKSGASQ